MGSYWLFASEDRFPIIFVGAGHALCLHDGFIFIHARVSPGIFVGAGHALRLHDGFIFIHVRVPTGIFVGAGHALRLHCGFIFIHYLDHRKLNSFLAIY